jgi:branched-chain amino acid transport system ATP-binding protein
MIKTLNSGAAATADPVLEITGLKAGYGRIEALHGIDLQIGAGQLVALVGANGAGKTTLLKTISGVIRSQAGQIRLHAQDISGQSPDRRVRLGISQVPEGRQVFGGLSVEDNLRLGAYIRKDAGRADDMEKMYGLFPILKEKRLLLAGMLSGGQQQMLAMARALMSRPKILLLDEPSMGLAPLLVEEIFGVIAGLKKEGIPILLVEQNAHAALSIADYGYVLETGNIATAGPGKTLLNDEKVRAAYLGM